MDAGKMTEKEMISKIGQALQGIFKPEDMIVQGGMVNKKKFN